MACFDFELIFDSSPLPIGILRDNYFLFVNRKMIEIAECTEKELLQIPFSELIHPDDRSLVPIGTLQQLPGKTGPVSSYEFRYVSRSGRVRYLKGVFSRIEFNFSDAVFAQFIDITDQKRFETALLISEEKYRMVVENASEGILVLQDSRIKYFNPRAAEIGGYGVKDIENIDFINLIHPDDQATARKIYFNQLSGQRRVSRHTLRIIDHHGQIKWMRVHVVALTWSGAPAVLAFISDITERRQVEEELILSKARFQQLFENSPEAIVMLDNSDAVIDINKGFEKLFQYRVDEVRGHYINDLIVPNVLLNEASGLSQAVLKGGTVQQQESLRRRKDGSIVEVSILAYPIKVNNKPFGIYGIYSDITKRKQTENQLRYLSLHDPLTGLYNRNFFEHEMQNLEDVYSAWPGIILCDVDGLKLVNDTLGHQKGDALLVAAANVIREALPEGAVVARIGGDEFAVLVRYSTMVLLEQIGLKIKQGVRRYNLVNAELPLSISLGVAVRDEGLAIGDVFKEADNAMYREKLHSSQSARSAIVQTLMKALEARDFITEGHADRLQRLVAAAARSIGLSESRVAELRLLARFHDIGKVGIPDRILFKPGALTQAEGIEMQRHSEIGYRIARSAPDLVPISDWILKHHEWWSGQGYPLGLKGKQIPLECRLLAIADAYDAMTSDRPYRKAMSHDEAVTELENCAGVQFDPELVTQFVLVLKKLKNESDDSDKISPEVLYNWAGNIH